VRSENETSNDVTDQVSSLRRALADAKAERASLLRRLAKVSDPGEASSLRARLRFIEARISQREGALRAVTNRVDYTSVALSLTPEAHPAAKKSGHLTPGGAARDAGNILSAALAIVVLVFASVLPLATIVLVGWLVIVILRRRLREQALDPR
jgi:hypothetical protein